MAVSLVTGISTSITAILTYYIYATRRPDVSSLPHGHSPWKLEPFFGVYESDLELCAEVATALSVETLGLPRVIADKGELQIFNKTEDGTRYQQYINFHDPLFSMKLEFQLGVPGKLSIPLGPTFEYFFVMLNATVLQGTYLRTIPGTEPVRFTAQFMFRPDASALIDVVTVSAPRVFALACPFYNFQV